MEQNTVNSPIRPLFVNENMGGHATMHMAIRSALSGYPEVRPQFLDVPHAGIVRRLGAISIPGLAREDFDLQALRIQLGNSAHVERRLRSWENPYDVLHVYSQNAALLSSKALAGRPSVVATDSTGEQGARILPERRVGKGTKSRIALTKLFEKKVYESATLVIAQSEWTANSLRTDYGVADERIRIVPFGINVHEPLPNVSNALPQITFVGTRLSRKGGDRLLDIWRRHLSTETTLTLVTRDDVKLQPGLRVFQDFRPGDPRLDTLLAATNLFVFPSEIDTFGYALIEAMAGEVATISLAVAARAEIAIDGVTGLVLPEGADDGALLAGIRELLSDPVRSREMGLAGRQRVLEHFDARITTKRLVEVLREAQKIFADG
ncbi:MAG: hypothetical protein RLY23_1547 [Actinomycetota bacterium]